MKFIQEEFDNYALEQGYENGIELFEVLGFTEDDYYEYY